MTTSAPTHHRKIDLQSPADLAYLQRNIHAAARQKFDLHFPPSAAQVDSQGGGDSLRGGVEEIVQTVCRSFHSGRLICRGWGGGRNATKADWGDGVDPRSTRRFRLPTRSRTMRA